MRPLAQERHGHRSPQGQGLAVARREGGAQFDEAVMRWLAYFEAEHIEQIASGAIILEKQPGETWFRIDTMPAAPQESASSHVLRVFAAQRRMQELRDDALLLDECKERHGG